MGDPPRAHPHQPRPHARGLLRTGKVLVIAGSGNHPGETVYKAAVWDPVNGTVRTRSRNFPGTCGATACRFSPTAGRSSRVAANPTRQRFQGPKEHHAIRSRDLALHTGREHAPRPLVSHQRPLPDGRTATFSGYDKAGNPNKTFEIYTVGSGWSAERPMNWPSEPPNYPRAHLTPQGDLFFSGWQRESQRFDPRALQWSYDVALTQYTATRRYGSSVCSAASPSV